MKNLVLALSVVALGIAIGVLDLHRVALRAAWPYVEAFWFTYIAF